MVTEIVILIVAIIAAILLWKVLKTVKNMVINTIMGLIVLVIANLVLGLHIAYDWIVILVCAIAGVVGALLIIVLSYLGIAF
ncbi:pro-sigmaK processing inhibitor BofA family protein [Methanolobus mangrovi]|uniref:Pro-sigmaK processing inhibitor BofA family protein n=1 Tax=Methanolobus mangrovi TaxID=3072977 RepID=A0AA51YG75_9EURY|nr:pro-sigmaK processing inhibitor BofA family protein [Methanolobus mangrovi]WMW21677.1 pro-sigmaK processing inhibitor BofA family protein [Methanolobus mangrovi]